MFKWANFFGKSEAERTIFSPNGRVEAHFILKSGELFYNVFRDHKNIVRTSRLGFLICGENPLGNNLKLIREHSKKSTKFLSCLGAKNAILKIIIPKPRFIFLRLMTHVGFLLYVFAFLIMVSLFVMKFRHNQNSNA